MTIAPLAPVVAAGVICWREDGDAIELLLIRRDSRADVSFPKGKPNPAESLQAAAVRETLEETGVRIAVEAPIGVTRYPLPGGREKIVHYWVAEADAAAVAAARFEPSAEVSAVEWVPIEQVRDKLTYDRDRELFDSFRHRSRHGTIRTFAIVVLRHGKAVPASQWSKPDARRPLQPLGAEQARLAAPAIAAYRPTTLISSTAERCVATIRPLADLLGLEFKTTASISQDAYEDGEAKVHKVIARRVAARETAVLCSHGPVLPEIFDQLAKVTDSRRDDALRRAGGLSTGDFAIVHIARKPGGKIVAVETHSPTRG